MTVDVWVGQCMNVDVCMCQCMTVDVWVDQCMTYVFVGGNKMFPDAVNTNTEHAEVAFPNKTQHA